jgi:predicted RNA-binding protein with PUA domain
MKECCDCEWMKSLVDSEDRTIYFCMNCDSPAYMEETGICGNCGMDEDDEEEATQ